MAFTTMVELAILGSEIRMVQLTISVRQAAVAAQCTMTFQYDRPLERHSYRQVFKSF